MHNLEDDDLSEERLTRVQVVPYDREWSNLYTAEHLELSSLIGTTLCELEHIGSTAVPGLLAKPIIDMMASVETLADSHTLVTLLESHGYHLIETDMRNRLFFRKRSGEQLYQLHVVEQSTWDERKERLMRDYLRAHPDSAAAYGDLKLHLAAEYNEDSLAYTKAKTEFIQSLIDKARAEKGMALIDVWAD